MNKNQGQQMPVSVDELRAALSFIKTAESCVQRVANRFDQHSRALNSAMASLTLAHDDIERVRAELVKKLSQQPQGGAKQ